MITPPPIAIPDEALDTHIGVLGRTGTGKTYTARGLVERLLDAKRQVVIIDPTSAWWGLRSVYPIPIFGGQHGDIEITDASGRAMAAGSPRRLVHRPAARLSYHQRPVPIWRGGGRENCLALGQWLRF